MPRLKWYSFSAVALFVVGMFATGAALGLLFAGLYCYAGVMFIVAFAAYQGVGLIADRFIDVLNLTGIGRTF